MKLSDLLCSSPEVQECEESLVSPISAGLPSSAEQQCLPATAAASSTAMLRRQENPSERLGPGMLTDTEATAARPVPDQERKRPYRMSVAQRRQRREHENYESRVFNLTLDINELRQQIRYLMERRDLHITRLLLNRQRFASDALKLVDQLLSCLRNRTTGMTPNERGFFFSQTHPTQVNRAPSGAVHQFAMQQARPTFNRHSFVVNSIQVIALVQGDDAQDEAAAEIYRVCGSRGGCVVEVLATFNGRFTRETVAAFFPNALCDEMLVSRLVSYHLSFPSRLLVYFDSQRRMVRQIAQADILAALMAQGLVGPNDVGLVTGDPSVSVTEDD